MILKNLKIENFRSYESADLVFSPSQNYIFGKNWQGKSSIMDAIGYAFFGKLVFPTKIAGASIEINDLVWDGAKSGYVQLTFEHNNEEYSLYRTCPTKKVELRSGKKILGQNATTVKEALKELFGLDHKLFLNIFYAEQDDLRKILDVAPEERRNFIEMLLGLEFVKEVELSSKHAFDDLEKFIDEITSGDLKTVIDMIGEIKEQVRDKEKSISEINSEIQGVKKELKKSPDLDKGLAECEKNSELLQTKLGTFFGMKQLNEHFITDIEKGNCPVCKQNVPKDAQLKIIQEIKHDISNIEVKLEKIRKELVEAKSAWSDISSDHDDSITSEQHLSDLEETIEDDKDELLTLKKSLAKYENQYKAYSNKKLILDSIKNERDFLDKFRFSLENFRNEFRKTLIVDLENGVNHFMSQFSDDDFDARLKIDERFNFEVILHGKTVPIFNLSGAAKDILALSLRYGLYRIAAREIDFILFDEPTRHMDMSNINKTKNAFNELRNQQMIIITVHDEFADAKGKKFLVVKNQKLVSEIQAMN